MASVPPAPSTPMLRPGTSGRATVAALPATSMRCPISASGGSVAGDRPPVSVGHERRPAAVEQPRLRSAAGILAVQLLQHRVDGLLGRLGHAQPLVAVRHPRLVVDDGVPARQVHRGVVGVGEDPARPRQADPQHELLEDRRSHPEGLDPGHVLAGQDEVDALAAAPPGEVFEQLDGLVGDGVLLAEQELELVDDRDDARPRTRHARRAQLLQLGDLVLLGHLGAVAHLRRRGAAAAPARTHGRC